MSFQVAFQPVRALSASFGLIRRAPGAMILGGLFAVIAETMASLMFTGLDPWSFQGLGLACLFLTLGLLGSLLVGVAVPGLATAVERAAIQGEERLGDVVQPRGRWLATAVVSLVTVTLQTLIWAPTTAAWHLGAAIGADLGGDLAEYGVALAFAAVVLPLSLYVMFGVMLAPYAAAFERLGPLAALGRAWRVMKGNRLRFLVWQIFWIVFVLAGLCGCIVGVLATGGIATIATAEAYLRLIRDDQERWAADGGPGAPLRTASSAETDESDGWPEPER